MKWDNDINIFRVRKTWEDIASQKGAFFILENAIKVAKNTKLNIYNSKKECVWNYKEESLCSKLH